MKILPLAVVGLLLASTTTARAATTITFEEPGVTAMSNSPGSAVPLASQLSNFYLSTLGVKFSSTGGFAAVADHGFPALTPSPPNIIGGTNAAGQLDYSSAIVASFFSPSDGTTKATTNSVSVLGDLFGLGSGTVTLEVYDVSGVLLGSMTAPDNFPLGTGPVLSVSVAGIHSAKFFSSNATVGFDNFSFNDLTAVPEPATWLMMLLGFAAVGGAMRRQRTTAQIKFA